MHYIDESKGARQQKDGKHMNNGHIWTVTYIEQKWKLERERERDTIVLPRSRTPSPFIMLLLSCREGLYVIC